jgi:predicted metalloprotease
MTFNPDADVSGNTARRRGRGAVVAGAGGVGLLGLIALIAGPLLGIDLTGLLGGTGTTGGGSEPEGGSVIENCLTGEDANEDVDCRVASAQLALDGFWEDHIDQYRAPQLIIVSLGNNDFSTPLNPGDARVSFVGVSSEMELTGCDYHPNLADDRRTADALIQAVDAAAVY